VFSGTVASDSEGGLEMGDPCRAGNRRTGFAFELHLGAVSECRGGEYFIQLPRTLERCFGRTGGDAVCDAARGVDAAAFIPALYGSDSNECFHRNNSFL